MHSRCDVTGGCNPFLQFAHLSTCGTWCDTIRRQSDHLVLQYGPLEAKVSHDVMTSGCGHWSMLGKLP